MKEFIHLHNHTEYSLLDGCAKIKKLVARAKQEGARAVAITDHGNVYGAIKFYKECKDKGIKPIIGCEMYLTDDISVKTREAERYHLVLLAKNQTGFKNLMKLNSRAFVDGFYSEPRIDWNLLKEFGEGLICLSGCIGGIVPQTLLNGDYDGAKKYAVKLKELFADGDFYIELQNHGIKEELQVLPLLRKIAYEIGVKCVATNDLHYVEKADSTAQDVLLCIGMVMDFDDPNRFRFQGDEFYYKTYDEMYDLFGDTEVLDATVEIADKIDMQIKFKEYAIPEFKKTEGLSDKEYLRKITFEGIISRYGEVTEELRNRAEKELTTISDMGFASYFLVVCDFIKKARELKVPVGPGRGSGAGSIVAYAIGITDIDPIKYDLIFERFLNSSRVSMPDFDVDFCSEGREKVIAYVREEYKPDHVAQIITFGKMKKKNAIKNVCRVFKIPFAESNALVKYIPNDPKTKIADLLFPRKNKDKDTGKITEDTTAMVPELVELYEDVTYKRIFDLAMAIEDLPRDRGMHAAGVIICSEPVENKIALSRNGDDIVTQFDMNECEELGLLKMDFLALNTLTDISKACEFVKTYKGVDISFEDKNYDDPEVYKLISNGETDTVFQLESAGMKDFMKTLKPTLFEEIIAGVSIFRPGPIENKDVYIYNKSHQDTIDYRHEKLVDILKPTYGIIVYQEQAMRITQALAGYTMNEADNFRKFMSKKKAEDLPKQMKKFLDGCDSNGVESGFAKQLWADLAKFGEYAFNKSHAAAYSVLTYQTAYLKRYYPLEFMCAVINNRITKPDDTKKYLRLLSDMKIKLLPPDINKSQAFFIPEGDAIRYGMGCIKDVGVNAVLGITEEREENGEFKDFADFVRRVPSRYINRSKLEGLIKGGAFDTFGYNRATMMANFEDILKFESTSRDLIGGGQMFFDFLVDNSSFAYRIVPESKKQMLEGEKEVLGCYLSGHPLDGYEEDFKIFNFDTSKLTPVGDLDEDEDSESTYAVKNGETVRFGGILRSVTVKISKNGNQWAAATVEDLNGTCEVLFFGRSYQNAKAYLEDGALLIFDGKINMKDGEAPKVEINGVRQWTLKDAEKERVVTDSRILYVNLTYDGVTAGDIKRVNEILENNLGDGNNVKLQMHGDDGAKHLYNFSSTVAGIDMIKPQIASVVGWSNVKIS